jgi:SAM-dependent methyltransferase
MVGGLPTGYVFDTDSTSATERHRCLEEAYDPLTCARLAETGVADGWRCLEIGAGGGSIARWLADRVAPTGSVVATDIQPEFLYGTAGVTVARHDVVHDPLPDNEFDLIHARLVLRNLPERDLVLRKLVGALKPGGWVQLDEFDIGYGPVLIAPDPSAAELYELFLAAKERVFDAAGADGRWGRKVAGAMVEAGLMDVDPMPVLQPWRAGSPGLRLLAHHTHHLRDKLIGAGMTDEQLAGVRAVLADQRFRATSCVMYSVHGRRPS